MPFDEFRKLVSRYAKGVVVDIGTGDGLFVYHNAKQNPDRLHIGIDSNIPPLRKISTKIYRKEAKGGLLNALYLQASAENLPEELTGIACDVYILLPWGSLLAGVVNGDRQILANVRKICQKDATLQILFTLDPIKDQSEINRLGLTSTTAQNFDFYLTQKYKEAGFDGIRFQEISLSEVPHLQTSWAKKLRQNKNRSMYLLNATAR